MCRTIKSTWPYVKRRFSTVPPIHFQIWLSVCVGYVFAWLWQKTFTISQRPNVFKGGCDCIGQKYNSNGGVCVSAPIEFAGSWTALLPKTIPYRSTRKIVSIGQISKSSRHCRSNRIRVFVKHNEYISSSSRSIRLVPIAIVHISVILLMPDAVQRLNTDFPNLAPVCLWYEQGKQRSIRAPNVFRSTLPDQIENNNASITALEEVSTK